MSFRFRVAIRLRPSVYDPQGEAIRRAIAHREPSVVAIRQGKLFEIEIEAASAEEARRIAEATAQDVLANPVLEDWSVEPSE